MTQPNPPPTLEELVHQHQLDATRLAYLITRRAARAPEIAQATLPAPASDFRARWLRGVRLNAVRIADTSADGEDLTWPGDAKGPETIAEREMRGLIWEAMGGLSPDARAVIALRFGCGLKQDALAFALGCSRAAADRRFRSAKRELAESLARAEDETSGTAFEGLFEEDTLARALEAQAALAIPPGRDYVGATDVVARHEEDLRPALTLSRDAVYRLIGLGAALGVLGVAIAAVSWFGRPPEVKPTPTPTPRPAAETVSEDCNLAFSGGELARIGRGAISRALWSPDGKSVWARSTSGMFVYDAATLRIQRCNTTFESLARISPDGTSIATGGPGARGLAIRDAATFALRTEITAAAPFSRAFSIDYHFETNRFVIVTADNTVEIRDGASGALLRPVVTLSGRATEARFSPDGNWVTAISFGRGLEIISAVRDTPSRAFRNPGGVVAEAVFSQDSQRVFVSDSAGIQVLDLGAGRVITTVRDAAGFARPIWANTDGSAVLILTGAASRDEAGLVLVDVATGKAARRLTIPASRFGSQSVVAAPDGARAIVVANDGFSVWDLQQGQLVNAIAGFSTAATTTPRAIAYSPDGKLLAAPRQGGNIALIDTATGRLARLLPLDLRQPVDLLWSPDGQRLAVADAGNPGRGGAQADATAGVSVIDLAADGQVAQFFPGAAQPQFSGGATYLFYRPRDGSEVRYYTFDTRVNTGYLRPSRTGETVAFDAYRISPDFGKMAVARGDAIEVWDIPRSERLAAVSGAITRAVRRDPSLLRLAMSPDNTAVLIVSPQDGVKVINWSPPGTRFQAAPPLGDAAGPQVLPALRAVFSPDGRWLATMAPNPAGGGSTLTLHDAATGRLAQRVEFATTAVGLAFSPDSRSVACLTGDDVIRLISIGGP